MITVKRVLYYCPGCRKTVDRTGERRTKHRYSYCEKTGKKHRMRLLKAPRARPASEILSKRFLDNWAKGGHTIRHVSDAEHQAQKLKRGERGSGKGPA